MIEVKAPNEYSTWENPIIFMAGSIEMGTAENWQTKFVHGMEGTDWLILNPRRDDWDSSWVQSADNPQFAEQVTWELNGLEDADIVIFYFDPNTKSPITLMELGMLAATVSYTTLVSVYVVCPEGFWRKGNVDVLCRRYGIAQFDNIELLIDQIKRYH